MSIEINKYFSIIRKNGYKVIFRVVYDSVGQTNSEPEFNIILQHMDDLKEIYTTNKDIIFVVEAGFLGTNGEWINGKYDKYMTEKNKIIEKLLEIVPEEIQISFRKPTYITDYLSSKNTVTESNAFSTDIISRFGLYNSGYLESETDSDTYNKLERTESINWQGLQTKYTSFGGEAKNWKSNYNDLENAIKDMFIRHCTYLNKNADENVIEKWKGTLYTGTEEIYNRRKGINIEENRTEKLHVNEPTKDVKLLKKLIIQIIICGIIYGAFYIIQNNKFIFSEDFLNKSKEILSEDTNFVEIYQNIKNTIQSFNQGIINQTQNNNNQQENQEQNNKETENSEGNTETKQEERSKEQEGIGGATEEQTPNQSQEQTSSQTEEQKQEQISSQTKEVTQEEQDINNIKNTTQFIKPIEGKISSTYGYRGAATGTVPKNHTGTDIASNTGTKIKSATEGEVVLASEEGDYGKHLKIIIGEVAIIYAHCNQLYVKQGDHVTQGQEIAEVGSTGNSTGPHLHFEIRYQERTVDPQKILEI